MLKSLLLIVRTVMRIRLRKILIDEQGKVCLSMCTGVRVRMCRIPLSCVQINKLSKQNLTDTPPAPIPPSPHPPPSFPSSRSFFNLPPPPLPP